MTDLSFKEYVQIIMVFKLWSVASKDDSSLAGYRLSDVCFYFDLYPSFGHVQLGV
jgi:hypothetical protein